MDVIKMLPEYLDTGLEDGELEDITRIALAKHIRELKGAIANAVINAKSFNLLDNLEGANKALTEARKFSKQYHHFLAELNRMNNGDDVESPIAAPE